MQRQPPALRIGTSGWSYDHWAGVFYPEDLSPANRLNHYASRFCTVEIDATFYRLPSENAVSTWHDSVPRDFVFSVKGSRLITHYRRLVGIDDALRVFLGRVRLLADKLGPVLWQLPPTLLRDDDVLESFLVRLSRAGGRHAVEFRHESWLDDRVFDLLRSHNTAVVNVSGDVLREDFDTTADFVYARLHGTSRYHGAYDKPALRPWTGFLREQLVAGRDCYIYFNNDAEGHAPADAQQLIDILPDSA